MKEVVEALALTVPGCASATWRRVRDHFNADDGSTTGTIGLTEEQVRRRGHRMRDQHYGVRLYERIENPPLT
jgi:hypothetical protein